MATLRLFAAAREAAATSAESIDADSVGALLAEARARHGEQFSAVLGRSRVWVNGEPADDDTPLSGGDEVAVLPPVSGGCGRAEAAGAREGC